MRGSDERTGELFSYLDIEEHLPRSHPFRSDWDYAGRSTYAGSWMSRQRQSQGRLEA